MRSSLLVDRAVVLSSLTPHTGNAVTTQRICSILPAERVTPLDVAAFATLPGGVGSADLAEHLASAGASLVLGVHAYRSGRLLIDCGVPFIIVLGGTDMNEHVHEPTKRTTIQRAIAQAAAVVRQLNVIPAVVNCAALQSALSVIPRAK